MAAANHLVLPPNFGDKVQLGLFGFGLFMSPIMYHHEITDSAGYSKFFSGKAVPSIGSREGMLMLYSPGLVTSLLFLGGVLPLDVPQVSCAASVPAVLGVMHFGKRILESLFVHKYSGKMELGFIFPSSLYYALSIAEVVYFAQPSPSLSSPSSLGGLALFTLGMLGNFYHHVLLRNLRKGDEKKYVVPTGGLFEYVACPHYLFELGIWFGMGAYSRSALSYIPAIAMTGYLAGRSKMTTNYYVQKLGEVYPKGRKHLIPFIY